MAADACRSERLIFYSPDGNEDPEDIERLDDLLLEGARLSIASRFADGAVNEEDVGLFRPRAWVNRSLTRLANILFNEGDFVTDTINGFRAIRRTDLLSLETTVKRFPIEYQISIRAMNRGWHISELATNEGQRMGGESKALSWPVGKDHIRFCSQNFQTVVFCDPKAHLPEGFLSETSDTLRALIDEQMTHLPVERHDPANGLPLQVTPFRRERSVGRLGSLAFNLGHDGQRSARL